MLQTIHDKTSGIIATVIMALLAIPFAFWGINYYFSGGKEPNVAIVNGKEIPLGKFQRSYENFRSQLQASLKKPLTQTEEEYLKEETLRRLVEAELLHQVSVDSGVRVSDQQVKDAIKGINVFSGENGFNREFYELAISRLGLPPALYEQQMRLDMMSEQLQSVVVESEFVTPAETDFAARLFNQERDLKYTIIESGQFKDAIQPGDKEISSFYNENQSLYKKPETVKIAYLYLNSEDLAAKVAVTDEELKAYYEQNKAELDKPEQRKLTQILIKTENATEKQKENAKTEADKISSELKTGKTFDDIAEMYKENTDINFSITELGFANKGALPKEVDEVAFSMQKGAISDVISTDLGYFIVRLDEIRGGVMNSFETLREEIEKSYRHKQAEQEFFDLADQLGTLAYENSNTLEPAADATGLTIQETDYFDRSITGKEVWMNPKVIDAAFSEDVLKNGHNSDIIELSDQMLVVLRVIDHKPESVKPLDEVRDTVINDVKMTEARKQAQETGKKVVKDLKSGKDLESVASTYNVEFKDVTGAKRDDISLNRSILRLAFGTSEVKGADAISGITMGTGDYGIVMVTAIQSPQSESLDKDKIKEIGNQMEAARSSVTWQEFMDTIKTNANVKTFPDIISN